MFTQKNIATLRLCRTRVVPRRTTRRRPRAWASAKNGDVVRQLPGGTRDRGQLRGSRHGFCTLGRSSPMTRLQSNRGDSGWRTVAVVALVALTTVLVNAQRLTIPQHLLRASEPLVHGWSEPSGRPPTLDQVLQPTDLIVRGIVGEPKSYLSDDQLKC
jgi:hypothetical protein